MAYQSKSGTLSNARSGTGRDFVNLPAITTVVTIFITTTGTFSLNLEVFNVVGVYIPIATLTTAGVVQVAMPVNGVAVNVTAVSGTVTVTYQMVVRDALPANAIQIFSAGALSPIPQPIIINSASFDNRKRLYGPAQPTNSGTAAQIYVVPTGKKTTVESIWVNNTTASDATITFSIGVDAAGTEGLTTYTVPANGILLLSGQISMIAAEVIQAKQGTLNALTMIINGTEV
jgi:hypothetical protein